MKHRSLSLSLLFFTAGCGGPWAKFYQPMSTLAPGYPSTQNAQVRRLPPERYVDFMQRMHKEDAENSVAKEDWTPEQRKQRRNEVMDMLQFSQHGGDTQIIGLTDFTIGEACDPTDGQLEGFARSIGANYAIWTVVDAGTV